MRACVFLLSILIYGVQAFIIPDEVPSLLSVIYSNIPILKKGTDSRLGWGFRLGNRADFQVLVELGPQKNTIPLGNQPHPGSTNNKRNVLNSLSNELYAQNAQRLKKEKEKKEAGTWLENWSEKRREPAEFELGVGEIDAKSIINPDATRQLASLYEKSRDGRSEVVVTTTDGAVSEPSSTEGAATQNSTATLV